MLHGKGCHRIQAAIEGKIKQAAIPCRKRQDTVDFNEFTRNLPGLRTVGRQVEDRAVPLHPQGSSDLLLTKAGSLAKPVSDPLRLRLTLLLQESLQLRFCN